MVNGHVSPSSIPLDMAQLQSVTGGKSSFQEELLEIFFFNVAECMTAMEHNCQAGANDKWYSATDELKNISWRLGAVELATICESVQKSHSSTVDQKKQQLANIRAHVQRLRAFVRNTRY